jgi:hypothetical protein
MYNLGPEDEWAVTHDIPLSKSDVLTMTLPKSVWKPRALLWAWALEVLNYCITHLPV